MKSSKKLMFIHPIGTFELEVPDVLYKILSEGIDTKLIRWRFTKTPDGLRGANSNMIIIDEYIVKEKENDN